MEREVNNSMVMGREEHENLLNELNNPEIDTARRNEVLATLRSDYGGVITETEKTAKELEDLRRDKEDLSTANSRLFRQLGITDNPDPDSRKKEEQKSFSETVTLTSLMKGK